MAPQERVKLSVAPNYKVNEEVWQELEEYLFTGFVNSPASIGDLNFIFKSLNHFEIKNIQYLKPSKSAPKAARDHFRSCFIAYSVFIAEGRNVIYERPRHINRLIKSISSIEDSMQDKLLEHLAALNKRASMLHPLVEVYTHENRSRFKWLQIHETQIHSSRSTGIHGTEELGMNYAQMTWTALNRVLDKREIIDQAWSNAKFIGSCMAKGVRQVDERDKARLETERTELDDKKMQVLKNYLNRTDGTESVSQSTVALPDGRTAELMPGNLPSGRFGADSAEELKDQLEKALNDEKDHHDFVVEAHFKKLEARMKVIEEQKQQIYKSAIPHDAGSHVMSRKALDVHLHTLEQNKIDRIGKAQRITTDINGEVHEASDEIEK